MEQIPPRSRDLIDMLVKQYEPRMVSAADLSTEEGRVRIAIQQGKIELVQQLKRRQDKQEEGER